MDVSVESPTPTLTPQSIHGHTQFPIPCSLAIICFGALNHAFDAYQIKFVDKPYRYFHLLSPLHVMFCQYENINFVVCTEVYGGPVIASIVEELYFYGVDSIIGVGFVKSIDEDFLSATNVCVSKALGENGTTPYYTTSEFIPGDIMLGSHREITRAVCWTTNSLYRENLTNMTHAKSKGCNVVNIDTAPFFAACKKLGMVYTYVATITSELGTVNERQSFLTELESAPERERRSALLEKAKQNLLKLVIGSIITVNKFPSLKYSTMQLKTIAEVSDLFQKMNMCKSHDIDHVMNVLNHTTNALAYVNVSPRIKFLIEEAALLHDVDDFKFTSGTGFPNARRILQGLGLCAEDIELVIEMISYVSVSVNGDNIPPRAKMLSWLLIVGRADRLEAVGVRGVIRCYEYAKKKCLPLYTDQTPKPKSLESVWEIATPELYAAYDGNSPDMITHYYQKLLRVGKFPTSNPYFLAEQAKGLDPLLAVLDLFIKDELTNEYFENLIRNESSGHALLKALSL